MKDRDNWHLTYDIAHERGAGDPFAAAVRATRMAMIVTDPAQDDNPIVFCNEAFQKLSGYRREEIIGRNCRFLQGPDTDPETVARIRAAVAAGEDIATDILNYRKDGSTFWNALYLSPVRNSANEIQFFFASQLDVTDRVEAQNSIAEQKAQVEREVVRRTADLEAALEAKTLLLHEVDHRVKNNLTMIGSILRLQARSIDNPVVVKQLETMLERIDALATVHRRLYQAQDVTQFDLGAFAENLLSDVVGAAGRGDVIVSSQVTPVQISSQKASAAGLILNELLTNALKHGRSADGARLRLTVTERDGQAEITVSDNGPGIMPGSQNAGLGMTLVRRLARQLGGRVSWIDENPGTTAMFNFPLEQA
jgi:PAS domain S-box-containing protein